MLRRLRSLGCTAALIAAVGALWGCSADNRYAYHDIVVPVGVAGTRAVAVGTLDQRPYVITRLKAADFVGLQRNRVGVPYDVTTASGQPLAVDTTEAVTASLTRRGFRVAPVGFTLADDAVAAVEKLKRAGADRLLLLTLKEWQTDTFVKVALLYEMTAAVYDAAGGKLGEMSLTGKTELGGSASDPGQYAERAVPDAFRKKIEELLLSPQIQTHLQ